MVTEAAMQQVKDPHAMLKEDKTERFFILVSRSSGTFVDDSWKASGVKSMVQSELTATKS